MKYFLFNFILILLMVTDSIAIGDQRLLMDVVFIIDGSAQSDESLFKQELLLIPKMVSHLSFNKSKIRFGLITYGGHATLQMGLGYVTDRRALLQKLWQIKHSETGRASLCYALRLVRTFMFKKKSNRRRFVIIFPNTMWSLPRLTNDEVQLLQQMDVKILMVVIGNPVDREAITRIMDTATIIYRPHITLNIIQQNYIYNFIINNIYEDTLPISSTTKSSEHNINSTYMATTHTITRNSVAQVMEGGSPTTLSGRAKITPRDTTTSNSIIQAPKSSDLSTVAITKSYFTENRQVTKMVSSPPSISRISTTTDKSIIPILPVPCSISGELILVLDATSVVASSDFQKILHICSEIITRIQRSNVSIDIAIVTFGTVAKIDMSFEKYRNATALRQLIMAIKQQRGLSGLGPALFLIKEKIFKNTIDYFRLRTVLIFSASMHVYGHNPIIMSEVMRQTLIVHSVLIRIGDTNKDIDDRISDNDAIAVKDFDELTESSDRIISTLCAI